ncbi:MAG TPA: indole-3-glycerol phosphate synthase TrpC [Chlorobaculum sp.]|uniref:Indole-3-glycerol phosphate synthase n=1 Tax=Chlorobaculum tepidum (strain ATCC 49652 / DSM 12025 / NBRC 103806 / TLS) TaxID=194439 RepID=TRPC_CHLTE|nr:indole-3-glycerol phosphate synthase TrpC [Chlorobaculum tepidum]Q8KBW1.1 RecName: Full=Indole-3-glycerol phosphate synthase; Short=IGPS [Chlorobaculum tepidum TLS]AAM72896.1 indole-3-glycerol phosphate synthase [Chlorobaculum tepidum TLS]HBU22524.1 indole-3-glycerol phosphate synthase TrpC [Chlorobaculum sp.]
MTYLTRILETKAREVAELKKLKPERRYREACGDLPATRDFRSAITSRDGGINLIAEVKKASPSRGVLVEDFRPLDIAARYAELGASAFSVLTDSHYFQGSPDYLKAITQQFSIPVLRKEFIIDESQIYETRLMGADAALLIVAALEPSQLRDYLQLFAELGLHALVEVHDRRELDIAIEQGSTIVGVNNRDLRDFTVDLMTSVNLKREYPEGVLSVAESGLKRRDDVLLMQDAGFDAVLIGEGLLASEELRQFSWG